METVLISFVRSVRVQALKAYDACTFLSYGKPTGTYAVGKRLR